MSNTPIPYPLPSDVGQSQPTASSSSGPAASSSTAGISGTQSRQEAEDARKDRTLAEFMLMLDDYEPLVSVSKTSGMSQRLTINRFQMKWPIIISRKLASNARTRDCTSFSIPFTILLLNFPFRKRLLSLAAQKFVSDIAADAFQHARIRTNAAGGRARANQPLYGGSALKDRTRTTLTMDDLSAALQEYGINARKPDYYL